MPFDQHWLVAAIAPRYVYIASGADPVSEMLTCVAAGEIYRGYGKGALYAKQTSRGRR